MGSQLCLSHPHFSPATGCAAVVPVQMKAMGPQTGRHLPKIPQGECGGRPDPTPSAASDLSGSRACSDLPHAGQSVLTNECTVKLQYTFITPESSLRPAPIPCAPRQPPELHRRRSSVQCGQPSAGLQGHSTHSRRSAPHLGETPPQSGLCIAEHYSTDVNAGLFIHSPGDGHLGQVTFFFN